MPSVDDPAGASLVFRAGGRQCMLPLEHIVETMRPLPVRAVAGAPPCVVGVAIVRGVALPVVDVARLLGESGDSGSVSSATAGARRFVTIRVGDRRVALAVDVVVGVRTLPEGTLREVPPLLRDAGSDAVATIGTLDAELLLVLRAARLVEDDATGGIPAGLAG
jgi:purine-binding chemotaxis protein CheW